MGKPLFIQTKVPEYLTRSDAKEWSHFKKPYYRFSVYPDGKSHQHNLLVDLSLKFDNSVFYVAPLFYEEDDFRIFIENSMLVMNSKFINTRRLPRIFGDDKHVICYASREKSKMWSEEHTIEDSFDGEMLLYRLKNIESVQFIEYVSMLRTAIDDFVRTDRNREYDPFKVLFQIGVYTLFIID